MKKEFKICDRCEGPVLHENNGIEIYMDNGRDSYSYSKDKVDLCADCRNSLISWFGKPNPFTKSLLKKVLNDNHAK